MRPVLEQPNHSVAAVARDDRPVLPGTRVDGRFRVERAIARGGMGTVYFARDELEGDAPIALKVLDRSVGESSSATGDWTEAASDEAATREAELLAELSHPAIVRFVANGALEDGRRYIAMEWVDGEDLGQHLNDRTLTLADTLRLGRRVAEALATAHRIGVIHRDIKPANIILTDGCPELARLVDFGIAQITRRSLHRGGTPGFAAPEQMIKGAEVDARADVFALGRVLIACLLHGDGADDEPTPVTDVRSGDLARGGAASSEQLDLSAVRADLPPALAALLQRMVAPQRELRPSHGGVVAAALQDIAAALDEDDDAAVGAGEQQMVATMAVPSGTLSGADAGESPALLETYDASLGPVVADCEFVHFHPHVADGDLAVRAARCALAVAQGRPTAPVALTIHQTGGDLEQAQADAAALLQRMRGAGLHGVGLNESAARLVGVRFEVETHAVPRLLGERLVGGARLLLGRPSPWVGRDGALEQLTAVYRESGERPVAAVITGDVGMGKSRLAQELLGRLERGSDPPAVWSARSDSMTAGSPFALIANLIKGAAGIVDGQPLRGWQRQLRRWLATLVAGAELERLTLFIAELIGAPFPDLRSEVLQVARQDPVLMARQTQRAWIDLVAAAGRAAPVVLWIDDLQWGDLASVRYLDDVLDAGAGTRLLVLAAGRPELHTRFPTLWSRRTVQRVSLAGLSAAECDAFVAAVLGARPRPDPEALAQRTQGNPLFLEELVRSLDAGTFGQLSATIAAIIQTRLQGLEFEARQILRAASVFGQTFWLEAVAALRGTRGAGDLGRWLGALAAQELVVPRASARFPDTREFEFRNITVRDAAYAMLPEADARSAHLVAGAWLTQAGEVDPVILAEHFRSGGDQVAATRRYVAAVDQAFLRHEFDAVLALTARALEHAPSGEARGRLLLRRAEVQGVSGNHHEAVQSATAALAELPTNSARWYSAVGEAAQASARLGDLARVKALLDGLSDIRATDDGGGENFLGLVRAAVPLAAAGAVAASAELLDNAARVTAKMAATDPGARGPMHAALALRALNRGAMGTAYEEMEAAAIAFERVGSIRNALELAGVAGFIALELGCRERGEESLRRTIRRSREVGLEHLWAVASHNLGRRIGEAGHADEGLELEQAALASFRAHGNRRMQGLTLAHIAWILLSAGRLDEAARSIDEALTFLGEHLAARLLAYATRAQIHLRRGLVAAALADATTAHTGLAALERIQEGESLIRLTWAEALAAAGRTDEAAAAVAAAVRNLDERAAMIDQEHLRASFRGLPENRRIAELAGERPPGSR